MQYTSHTYYYIVYTYQAGIGHALHSASMLWKNFYTVTCLLLHTILSSWDSVKTLAHKKRLQVSSADFIFTPSNVHHHLRALEQQVDSNPLLYCTLQSQCFDTSHCSVDILWTPSVSLKSDDSGKGSSCQKSATSAAIY